MRSTEQSCQPLLLAFGNPLLDMTVVLEDASLHEQFNLPEDGQLEVSKEQQEIFDIVKCRNDIQYTAGGCALNALRVFSWVIGEHNRAIFVGGIGEDEAADKLNDILSGCGVLMNFIEIKEQPTGTCVALVLGAERCLCADIGAASFCPLDKILVKDKLVPPLESASLVYIEGYFVTHSFVVALRIARYCRETNKPFVFNLCGSYVCENHSEELSQLLPYVDIVFGFYEEYKTLERFVNIPELCEKYSDNEKNIVHDLNVMFKCFSGEESAIVLDKAYSKLANCENGDNDQTDSTINNHFDDDLDKRGAHSEPWSALKGKKYVIVTRGAYPLLYTKGGIVYEQEIPSLSQKKIVDTTGAGDSFVGGFLAAASKGKELEECLECGVWSAQQILLEKGCTIPKKRADFL